MFLIIQLRKRVLSFMITSATTVTVGNSDNSTLFADVDRQTGPTCLFILTGQMSVRPRLIVADTRFKTIQVCKSIYLQAKILPLPQINFILATAVKYCQRKR